MTFTNPDNPPTELSGTVAYLAALALRKNADKCDEAAKDIADEFPGAAANCVQIGEWNRQVAHALECLDVTATPIVRAS